MLKSGWTGGQYSLYRAALAAYLATWGWPFAIAAVPAAIGFHARVAWFAMWVLVPFSTRSYHPAEYILAGFLVLLQIFISPDPYLSLDRAGAADPGTEWSLPRWIPWASGVTCVAACIVALIAGRHFTPAIVFAALLAIPPLRAIPGNAAPGLDTVFYDGHCALCHGSVRFLLAEDPDGEKFRFAPLQSPAFEAAVPVETRHDLPDSIVVSTASGGILIRYAAVRYLLQRLGGYWRVLGTVLIAVPSAVGDAFYNLVAGNRYRIFGQQADVCPLVPSTLRNRFDIEGRTAGER